MTRSPHPAETRTVMVETTKAACPNESTHTRRPELYLHWYSWAERMSKTHAQVTCEGCGRWMIWLPNAQAREVNKRKLREKNEFLEAHGLPKMRHL